MAVYYVSSSVGSDSNTGLSEEQAWASLDKVASSINGGDTIKFKYGDSFVRGTSFEDPTAFYFPDGIDANNRTYATAYGDSTLALPKLSRGGCGSYFMGENIQYYYVVRENSSITTAFYALNESYIDLVGCSLICDSDQHDLSNTILLSGCDNVLIDNCSVHGYASVAIQFSNCSSSTCRNSFLRGETNAFLIHNGTTTTTITNCTCIKFGNRYGSAIEIGRVGPCTNNVIKNNRVYSTTYALFLQGEDNLAYNNIIMSSGSASIAFVADGTYDDPKCKNVKVYNNTCFSNAAYSILIHKGVTAANGNTGNECKNNIFVSKNVSNPQFISIDGDIATSVIAFDFNIYYREYNTSAFRVWYNFLESNIEWVTWTTTYGQDTNSSIEAPKVMNSGKLYSDSPCIGNGLNLLGVFTMDYKNKDRALWDIGSDEYSGFKISNMIIEGVIIGG